VEPLGSMIIPRSLHAEADGNPVLIRVMLDTSASPDLRQVSRLTGDGFHLICDRCPG
jgi:hypothetical protein